MTTMLDHLGALLVGGIVLAALGALALRGQTDGVEAVSFHALQEQATSFGETLRLDLESVSTPVSLDGSTGAFAFQARLTPHDTTQQTVVYDRVAADTLDGVPHYTIARTVDGVPSGGSPGLLRTWTVEAQTSTGSAATLPGEVSQIHVAFEVTTPYGARRSGPALTPERVLWEATVVPQILHFTSP